MNFKKLSAAMLAAGMALTAAPIFATETYSPDATDKNQNQVELGAKDELKEINITEVDDKVYTVEASSLDTLKGKEKLEVETVITDEDYRNEIIESQGFEIKKDTTTIVLGGINASLKEGVFDATEMPNGTAMKVGLQLDAEATKAFKGMSVYVMHYDEALGWRVDTVDVDDDGLLVVNANKFSPFIVAGAVEKRKINGKDVLNPISAGKATNPGDGTTTGNIPSGEGTPGAADKKPGTNNGGSVNAGSTTVLGNKVSPNTAA